MNPLSVILADLRHLRWVAVAIVALTALGIAIGVAISAQERAVRQASARAADDFDLLVGAPGSQTQLVLSAVYLQPEALPLAPGETLNRLGRDPGARFVSPVAFGDVVRGYPVVGVTRDLATRWGRLAATEGRLFDRVGEAVVGSAVHLALGETVVPSHALAGHRSPFGIEAPDEHEHRHEGAEYRIVGRLPATGSPWDRAILVPVEAVWAVHGLGDGHAPRPSGEASPIGPPFDAAPVPGVPAIVVKARSVADAYRLRGAFRQGGTMALFPAEVLVSLYGALGNLKEVLAIASAFDSILVFAAIGVLLLSVVATRRRRYAVLRALGAPPAFIIASVWLGAALLLALGCIAGLVLGLGLTRVAAMMMEMRTGLIVPFTLGPDEFLYAGALFLVAGGIALVPAVAALRIPVADALRS